MFGTWLYFSLIVFSSLWTGCDPLYITSYTQNRIKQKIFYMQMELVKDVIMKIWAVEPWKHYYSQQAGYETGSYWSILHSHMDRMSYLYWLTYEDLKAGADDPDHKWDVNTTLYRVFEVDRLSNELDVIMQSLVEAKLRKPGMTELVKHLNSRRGGDDSDDILLQFRAYYAQKENPKKKTTKKHKTGKWHYGGDMIH